MKISDRLKEYIDAMTIEQKKKQYSDTTASKMQDKTKKAMILEYILQSIAKDEMVPLMVVESEIKQGEFFT